MIKFIAILIILISIALVFYEQEKPASKPVQSQPIDVSEKINKYMQEIEFQKKAQEIKSGAINEDIDLEKPAGGSLEEDLSRGGEIGAAEDEYIEPDRGRWQDEHNEADGDAAYMQQFIENARKDGYIIKLDKNYQIIDIKKVGE